MSDQFCSSGGIPKPDVLLIQPPIADFYLTAKRTLPYGLASIAASLKANGISVEILDALATSKSKLIPLPREMEYLRFFYGKPDRSPFALFSDYRHFGNHFDHIGRRARESGSAVIGISSLFTPYSQEALLTAEAVKRHHPDCRIVMGGHHPTALPESVMACPAVDFVIRGDGEPVMPLLVQSILAGRSPENLPGVVSRNPDGSLRMADPVYMDHLENYPPADLAAIKTSFYRRHGKPAFVVMTSRGCPMHCSYCCFGEKSTIPYRRKSMNAIRKELDEAILVRGAGFIDFEDENLSMDRNGFMEMLLEIRKRYAGMGVEFRAMNGLYPPTLDAEVIRTMREAGFTTLNLSLGSISRAQLARFHRPDVRRSFEGALTWAREADMDAVGYILVSAPGQDPYDSLEDLLYLAGKRVLAGVSVFYPAPGSLDYTRCSKEGLLPEHPSRMRSTALPISHTTSRLQAVTLLRLGRIVNAMKSLADRGIWLQDILSGPAWEPGRVYDRETLGPALLSRFFQTGTISGITSEGDLFDHPVDAGLTRRFIEKLPWISLCGVRRSLPELS